MKFTTGNIQTQQDAVSAHTRPVEIVSSYVWYNWFLPKDTTDKKVPDASDGVPVVLICPTYTMLVPSSRPEAEDQS